MDNEIPLPPLPLRERILCLHRHATGHVPERVALAVNGTFHLFERLPSGGARTLGSANFPESDGLVSLLDDYFQRAKTPSLALAHHPWLTEAFSTLIPPENLWYSVPNGRMLAIPFADTVAVYSVGRDGTWTNVRKGWHMHAPGSKVPRHLAETAGCRLLLDGESVEEVRAVMAPDHDSEFDEPHVRKSVLTFQNGVIHRRDLPPG